MTRQESFKKTVRMRMAKTGERYSAARANMLETSQSSWKHEPEMADETVRAATGRGWEEWRSLIDAGPAKAADHPTIVQFLISEHDVDHWWAQGITVGYERITGLRLPFQRPDGTFTAGKSRTVAVDISELTALLKSAGGRKSLFPGIETELVSRPTAKTVRIKIGPGVALIAITEKPKGRASVTVNHEALPTFEEVDPWKAYWSEWLAAIDQK